MKTLMKHLYEYFTHIIGRMTKRYYFEDYVRVYPDGIAYSRFAKRRRADQNDINNYLNHRKFYYFVSQFVAGKVVADVGCGSGYGCEILKQSGALQVFGCDISKRSIEFAESRFIDSSRFSIQGITNLVQFKNSFFDVSISNEVIEHIKEYRMEDKAIQELKRITKHKGLVIVGTPNNELLHGHGFSFDEIGNLFKKHFNKFCIFENALLPYDREGIMRWEKRKIEGKIGIIITERINLSETVLPLNVTAKIKMGLPPGEFTFDNLVIHTEKLHNTHSWIVIAINE